MYLDSAYIAKFYVNEVDSRAVRNRIRAADTLVSSEWAIAEVSCVLHRHVREGSLKPSHIRELLDAFEEHVEKGVWRLMPVTRSRLERIASLVRAAPQSLFLRAGDAIHLVCALESGEREIWTNDRHLLAAAAHFGLVARTVGPAI
ncbi:MAG TPA: type II toxin-antitoxin system VapC family toxin [Bryobacteraceae bacterium]|nr:type II toxin-antitoxin system VapC family toxin [Bryobacteraceae bacterium]